MSCSSSSSRRARTRAIRTRVTETGESFTAATFRSGPPPTDTDVDDVDDAAAGEVYEHAVFGRLSIALQGGPASISDSCKWFHPWHQGGRRKSRFVIEWGEGPYAHEVHEDLLRVVADPDERFLLPYEITTEPRSGCATASDTASDRETCNIVVGGVPILLRSLFPIGREAASKRTAAELAAVWADIEKLTARTGDERDRGSGVPD